MVKFTCYDSKCLPQIFGKFTLLSFIKSFNNNLPSGGSTTFALQPLNKHRTAGIFSLMLIFPYPRNVMAFKQKSCCNFLQDMHAYVWEKVANNWAGRSKHLTLTKSGREVEAVIHFTSSLAEMLRLIKFAHKVDFYRGLDTRSTVLIKFSDLAFYTQGLLSQRTWPCLWISQ